VTAGAKELKIRVSLNGSTIDEYTFHQDMVTIDSNQRANIVLEQLNPRQRARFLLGMGGFWTIITDKGDEEVLVNDERVQHHFVYSNDIVKIGPYTLWLQVQV